MDRENILITKSKQFALNVMQLCKDIKNERILTNQLLRSATSIGANIHEANYAHSKPDFISKLQIALKECYETEYWLDLLITGKIINENFTYLIEDCVEIKRILISSCKTAKKVKR